MSSTAIDTIPATVTDAGRTFNYANWSPGTVLTLVNVPWNNDYRDIVRFSSRTARDAWIDNEPNVTINRASLNRFQSNVRVNLPLNAAGRYNYLRAENPLMPVDGDVQRNYYYFITGVAMLAPNTTELTVQLDVFQTFGYDATFGSAFVERGHIGIANTKAFNHYGRDYLDEPEGFDVGGEYRVVHVSTEKVMSPGNLSILICSTVNLTLDPGTVENPHLYTAHGGSVQGLPSGAEFYYFNSIPEFSSFMAAIADKPWIGQGIVSITAVPKITRYYDTDTGLTTNGTMQARQMWGTAPTPVTNSLASNWRDSSWLANVLGARYASLKKFLTAPYLVLELTTFTGSPIVLKPQHWQNGDANIIELSALVPPGQRLVFSPKDYNADGATTGVTTGFAYDDEGEYLNMAVTLDNFPSLPLVNSMAINFLASNKNGIQFQFQSAEWSQQRALQGAGTAYGQAEQGIRTQRELNRIGQTEASDLAALNAATTQAHGLVNSAGSISAGVIGGAGSVAGGNIVGGVGAVGQGLNGAVTISTNSAITAASGVMVSRRQNQAAEESTRARTGQAQYNADTNLSMARFAARGDYANAVSGTIAKVQDAAMMQPSTSGQFGGDAFNLVNGNVGYSLRFKLLGPKHLRAIGDYWLRYGYAVNQFASIPTTLMCMSKFTYWKLTETYISQGPFPEVFKQILRGIFEKGVTVWANPHDIGVTDWADNEPLSGITL